MKRDSTLVRSSRVFPTRLPVSRAQAAAEKVGMPVDEGVHRLSSLLAADEAYVLSTSSDLTPVTKVGDVALASAPDSEHRARILAAMDDLLLSFE